MTKVAIPAMQDTGLEAQIGRHFGRVPYYTVYHTESEEVEVLPNTSAHAGGSGLPAEILAKEGIEVMICSGLGRRAISLFEKHGVMVYIGASGTIEQAIQAWQEGELSPATDENACAEHAFRGEDVGEGGHKHDHHH